MAWWDDVAGEPTGETELEADEGTAAVSPRRGVPSYHARMDTSGGRPMGGRHRNVDRDALPDPSLWVTPRSPHARAVKRIVLAAVAMVTVLTLSSFGLRAVLARASAARSAIPALPGLDAPLLGAMPEKAAPVSPEELASLQKSWIGSESLAPRDDRLDAATGERVAPFHGFGLQVDSVPAGARAIVDGEDKGTTPLLTTVDCRPGDEVSVELDRAGERGRARTRCRADTLVKLRVSLTR